MNQHLLAHPRWPSTWFRGFLAGAVLIGVTRVTRHIACEVNNANVACLPRSRNSCGSSRQCLPFVANGGSPVCCLTCASLRPATGESNSISRVCPDDSTNTRTTPFVPFTESRAPSLHDPRSALCTSAVAPSTRSHERRSTSCARNLRGPSHRRR